MSDVITVVCMVCGITLGHKPGHGQSGVSHSYCPRHERQTLLVLPYTVNCHSCDEETPIEDCTRRDDPDGQPGWTCADCVGFHVEE